MSNRQAGGPIVVTGGACPPGGQSVLCGCFGATAGSLCSSIRQCLSEDSCLAGYLPWEHTLMCEPPRCPGAVGSDPGCRLVWALGGAERYSGRHALLLSPRGCSFAAVPGSSHAGSIPSIVVSACLICPFGQIGQERKLSAHSP